MPSSFWPQQWPLEAHGLAALAIACCLSVSVIAVVSHTLEVCGYSTSMASAFGNWQGLSLLIAAAVCWWMRSRLAHWVIDIGAAGLIAAPIVADTVVTNTQLTSSGAWTVMLALWTMFTAIGCAISFVPRYQSLRGTMVPIIGSGLLISGGLLSMFAGVGDTAIWLTAWIAGTIVGVAVSVHRGSARGIRTIGGIPVLSGIIAIFAIHEEAQTLWTQLFLSLDRITVVMLVVSWILVCGSLWRMRFIRYKQTADTEQLGIFRIDMILLWLGGMLMALMSLEISSSIIAKGLDDLARFGLPLWLMLAAGALAAVLSVIRWDSPGQLSLGYVLDVCQTICILSFATTRWFHDVESWLPAAALSLGLLSGVIAWLWPMRRLINDFLATKGIPWASGSEPMMHRELSGWFIATLLISVVGAIASIIADVPVTDRWIWIGAIVAGGIATGRLGRGRESDRLRTLAVGSLCIAAMLGAIADVPRMGLGDARPLVHAMRLFIASVWLIPLVTWAAPKVFMLSTAQWRIPIRRAATMTAAVATVALIAIFCIGLTLRQDGIGIPAVPKPLVYGTSIVIGVFSLIAMAIAVFPVKFLVSKAEQLTEGHRKFLVYASQTLMLLAIANKSMCRPGTLGIREYWPFIVMTLAFVSAGLSSWARRRGDQVLLAPLRNSALYLPVIPIVGFWLTSDGGWVFAGGNINYNVMLVIAAVFYLAMSVLWPGDRWPKIAGIVAANAALWVTLTQFPGWGFVQHPQLWLIPPAVCVLAALHYEKDRLQPQLVTACRYAATLVIYISSTADMIVQQIGSSIAGPIILICLAFVGVTVGVILQVRAFLYLGTSFIVVGLVSMVWHAGKAIDQVWPWWAFGITTGLLLLGGLMAIEKHKESLRRLAARLSQWEA